MSESKKLLPLPNPYYIQIGRTLYKAERVRVWNQWPADGGDPRWMPRTRLTPVEPRNERNRATDNCPECGSPPSSEPYVEGDYVARYWTCWSKDLAGDFLQSLECRIISLQSDNASLREQKEAGDKFKAYVHKRLDEAGVPHSVEWSEHTAAGCRVGGRLDFVLGALHVCPVCQVACKECRCYEDKLAAAEREVERLREGISAQEVSCRKVGTRAPCYPGVVREYAAEVANELAALLADPAKEAPDA